MARAADVLLPRIAEGATVVGLEPSCILTFRAEAPGGGGQSHAV